MRSTTTELLEPFTTWWLADEDHPICTENEPDIFDESHRCFIAGAHRDVCPIYAAGMRQATFSDILRDAFFAGHAWRTLQEST